MIGRYLQIKLYCQKNRQLALMDRNFTRKSNEFKSRANLDEIGKIYAQRLLCLETYILTP